MTIIEENTLLYAVLREGRTQNIRQEKVKKGKNENLKK